jgi:hypothetical protein
MVLSLAFVFNVLAIPLIIPIVSILFLVLAAGLTSPYRAASAILNIAVSVASLLIFEYYAVTSWQMAQKTGSGSYIFLFVINQILTILFLYAVYLSVKTWRGLRSR